MNNCKKYMQKIIKSRINSLIIRYLIKKKNQTFSPNIKKFYRYLAQIFRELTFTLQQKIDLHLERIQMKAMLNFGRYTRSDCVAFIVTVLPHYHFSFKTRLLMCRYFFDLMPFIFDLLKSYTFLITHKGIVLHANG